MTIASYIDALQQRYSTGISREHAYRGDLQSLLTTLLPDILVINEPARVACGAPDYVLTKRDIPVGYVEAKDIGVDLKNKSLKEQFDRYRSGLSNLIFTDYLDFHFYKDGVFTTSVKIGKLEFPSGGVAEGRGGLITPLPENYETFENLIQNFALTISQTIKNPTKLAEMMAGKAKLMADVIEKSLQHDDEHELKSNLKNQMLSFKQMLIHDITNTAFADIYAQTIAYGMFAARYHDPTLPTFSRQEAATLIPKSNPFLRKLFQDIAGYDLDDRLVWMVDELVSIFLATDVADIMKNFGKSTKQEDPVVHFYETFLAAYNPALRKARGVWYTPQPVVNFIVRAVDDILKTEFNLPQGLADTSKIKVKTKHLTKSTADQRSKLKEVETEQEVHKVQILDPATGTGTFLAEVVKHIYKKFEGQQGIWSNYVSQHLIPRLNGFELLMASYAMAHLKMDMLLTETGYKATSDQRFRIFLTNSLEEAHLDTGTLFSSWLSDEADAANVIKRETPVMVVMGNPPYSIVSSNLSSDQRKLIERYKYIDGVKIKEKGALQLEKNLNDDYVKFISLAEQFISKNGEGVLAFINNNNFLDAITLRGMRWNLLNNFDTIYIIDAHGNAMKKEISPNGEKDENIFDIQQGVSINIFVKKENSLRKKYAKIFHYDLFGKRENKYDFLKNNTLSSIKFEELQIIEGRYYFVYKDFDKSENYYSGLSVETLFKHNVTGVKTHRDSLVIGINKNDISNKIKDFYNKELDLKVTLNCLGIKDTGTWNSQIARERGMFNEKFFQKIQYRPFDELNIYYDNNLIDCNRVSVMKHFINDNNNIGLIIPRQAITDNWSHIQVTNSMVDNRVHYSNKGTPICCPLYLYPDQSPQTTFAGNKNRIPNLDMEIVNKFAEGAGLHFVAEENPEGATVETNQFHPIDILDYIYAVLHCPAYREKYKEFLKIDFPRVPYPTHPKDFYDLVDLGSQLRKLHLLESEETENYITQYPIDGNNEVGKPLFVIARHEAIFNAQQIAASAEGQSRNDGNTTGKVYINETQYFDNVPEVAWNFYIGGYQPAQKWLKDRKGRTLEFDDILHYQKIIKALSRTGEIMVEIDKVLEVH